MRHLIGEEKAANLKRGDGTPIVLPTLSSDEIRWIEPHLPFPPRVLPSMLSLSGLLFADAVNFQGFYFPFSVAFRGSRFEGEVSFRGSIFEGNADFKKSTFGGIADFAGSTFAGDATFTASTFGGIAGFAGSIFAGSTFGGIADFAGSTFGGIADFAGSTFAGTADFAGSTFEETADFAGSTFEETADFAGSTFEEEASFAGRWFKGPASFAASTFGGIADFAGSTFAETADFSNSTYEGKTSFQNVTFTRAPLFFATTLHEDTDWTRITWPAKPEDKEDATEYVRRYERLALIMSTLKQPDNEHQFFRLSMRAKEVRDGWGINIISTFSSRLYGLFFRYGWGFERALGLWVAHLVLGAVYLRGMALWQMSQPLSWLKAVAISFSNSLPFLGLQRGPAKSAYACFDTLTGFNITYACFDTLTGFNMLWTIQSLSGPILLFFLLLTIRNRFRFRFQ